MLFHCSWSRLVTLLRIGDYHTGVLVLPFDCYWFMNPCYWRWMGCSPKWVVVQETEWGAHQKPASLTSSTSHFIPDLAPSLPSSTGPWALPIWPITPTNPNHLSTATSPAHVKENAETWLHSRVWQLSVRRCSAGLFGVWRVMTCTVRIICIWKWVRLGMGWPKLASFLNENLRKASPIHWTVSCRCSRRNKSNAQFHFGPRITKGVENGYILRVASIKRLIELSGRTWSICLWWSKFPRMWKSLQWWYDSCDLKPRRDNPNLNQG